MTAPALVWLRNDLRLADNPALVGAVATKRPLVVLYVLEDEVGPRPLGAAARWWLHHSLAALGERLAASNVSLVLRRGDARLHVVDVAAATGAASVFWNERYAPAARSLDGEVRSLLAADGRRVESSEANLLAAPSALRTGAGRPYRVFSPFARTLVARGTPRPPLPEPALVACSDPPVASSDTLDDWHLRPQNPNWAGEFTSVWTPGENAARQRLAHFLAAGLGDYADGRDFPAAAATSQLSPHLRFGEISPFEVWQAAAEAERHRPALAAGATKFRSEILWREFSWHLLANERDLAAVNVQPKFDTFPWRDDPEGLATWRKGRTGYPIVDAGMRGLWRTGTMHNRVRMVVASFLAKHLLIDWREGERWFWDTLVDADEASNPANWQWVAGTGADAAPYFRIFNPILQGEKFDPDGTYVRHFVPELDDLDRRYLHRPWEAGLFGPVPERYPAPIVEHEAARERALAALRQVSGPP